MYISGNLYANVFILLIAFANGYGTILETGHEIAPVWEHATSLI